MCTYSAFPNTAVLPALLCHSVDVNKVVMGRNSQEVSIWIHKKARIEILQSSEVTGACVTASSGSPCWDFTWRILDIGNDLIAIRVHRNKIVGVGVQHKPPKSQSDTIQWQKCQVWFHIWSFFKKPKPNLPVMVPTAITAPLGWKPAHLPGSWGTQRSREALSTLYRTVYSLIYA